MINDSKKVIEEHEWFAFHLINLSITLILAAVWSEFYPRGTHLTFHEESKSIAIKRLFFFRKHISFKDVESVNVVEKPVYNSSGPRLIIILQYETGKRAYVFNHDVKNFDELKEFVLKHFPIDKTLKWKQLGFILKLWLGTSLVISLLFVLSSLL